LRKSEGQGQISGTVLPHTQVYSSRLVLVHPLQGSDRKTSNETRVITKQQLRECVTIPLPSVGNTHNGRTVGSGVFCEVCADAIQRTKAANTRV
jgi:hypothetical protein